MTIREQADRILHDLGLLAELEKYGKPHPIGSYRMDMMAWNDLDIDIENSAMSLDRLYELTGYILKTFRPFWYEAKEEITSEGKTVWFQGFEAMIGGERWNFDLWFFDRETIDKAEAYCDGIAAKTDPEKRRIITALKKELIARGLYHFERYRSIDVYRAVLELNVETVDELFEKLPR